MASYQAKLEELEALEAMVVAATVEDRDSTKAMAQEFGLAFPIAFGITDSDVEGLEPWWADDHHGHYPQPMEFLVIRGGTVFGSLYASGPIGRMDVNEVLVSIEGRERRRLEQQTS